MKISRRDLLKRTLVAGTGGAVGTAGCLRPPTARAVRLPDTYRSWVYDPTALGGRPHVVFYALDVAAIEANGDRFSDPTYRKYANYTEFLGLGALGIDDAAVDTILLLYPRTTAAEQCAVLTGSFRRDALVERLRRRFERESTHGGFSIHWSRGDDVAVGVGNRYLLLGHPTERLDAQTVVARVVDTFRGRTSRRVETSDAFDTLTEAVGSGDDVSGFTHPRIEETNVRAGSFEGSIAKGQRYVFGPETSKSRYAFVFETETAVDTDAVEAWIDANDDTRLFGGYERVTVRRRGRTAIVDGVVSTESI